MKIFYSTNTLRYLHDVVTGEFANIGVVVFAPEQRFLEARFATSYERLNAIFLKIDHLHFRVLMRYMASRFEELGLEIRYGLNIPPVNALSEIVKQVLPPDDSSLQWSQQGGGITDDPAGDPGANSHHCSAPSAQIRLPTRQTGKGNSDGFGASQVALRGMGRVREDGCN